MNAILGACLMGLSLLFGLAYCERYWRWRDCFNDLGRCYDPVLQEEFLEQAGVAWGSLTLICLLLGISLIIRHTRRI